MAYRSASRKGGARRRNSGGSRTGARRGTAVRSRNRAGSRRRAPARAARPRELVIRVETVQPSLARPDLTPAAIAGAQIAEGRKGKAKF